MELNIEQIKELIPHRYPFLLVDRITECVPGERAVGLKCVSANEPFFQGHFPEFAVMPGVLIVEALAQVGAVAILSVPENKGKLALFWRYQKCAFQKAGTPRRPAGAALRADRAARQRGVWQRRSAGGWRSGLQGRAGYVSVVNMKI